MAFPFFFDLMFYFLVEIVFLRPDNYLTLKNDHKIETITKKNYTSVTQKKINKNKLLL